MNLLFAQEGKRRDFDFHVKARSPDHGFHPALGEHGKTFFNRLLQTDAFERMINPAPVCQRHHLLDNIAFSPIDNIGGTVIARHVQLGGDPVNRDDLPGPRRRCARHLDHVGRGVRRCGGA